MRTVLIERDIPEDWWKADELRSEVSLPGWEDFTAARERFFAAIERLGAAREEDGAPSDGTGTGDTSV